MDHYVTWSKSYYVGRYRGRAGAPDALSLSVARAGPAINRGLFAVSRPDSAPDIGEISATKGCTVTRHHPIPRHVNGSFSPPTLATSPCSNCRNFSIFSHFPPIADFSRSLFFSPDVFPRHSVDNSRPDRHFIFSGTSVFWGKIVPSLVASTSPCSFRSSLLFDINSLTSSELHCLRICSSYSQNLHLGHFLQSLSFPFSFPRCFSPTLGRQLTSRSSLHLFRNVCVLKENCSQSCDIHSTDVLIPFLSSFWHQDSGNVWVAVIFRRILISVASINLLVFLVSAYISAMTELIILLVCVKRRFPK